MRAKWLQCGALFLFLVGWGCGTDGSGARGVAAAAGTSSTGPDATAGTTLSGGANAAGSNGTGAGAGGGNNTGGAGHAGSSSDGGAVAGGGTLSAGAAGTAGAPSAGSVGMSVGGPEILVPAQGALLGQFYGDASIAATSTKLGRTLPLHLTYYAWNAEWHNAKPDLDNGRIPFVNWEPFDVSLDEIVSGAQDPVLAARAKQAVALKGKLFVDFGAEMNGDWSPWSGAQNGQSPDKYIAAYRYIHDKLVGAGATNIIWAWCPNVTDEPRQVWNDTLKYYPGDQYVDWVCVDGYNWGGTNDIAWQSFHDVFQNVYAKLATLHKPIIIGEMASAESGGNKAQWISGIVTALQQDFPLIKALLWFDINKEADWRISSSSASEAAFAQMAKDPYFNP